MMAKSLKVSVSFCQTYSYDLDGLKMRNPRLPFWTGRVLKIEANRSGEAEAVVRKVRKAVNSINKRYKANKNRETDKAHEGYEANKEHEAQENDFDYDTNRPGIYILLGEEDGKNKAYIGKADENIGSRLPQSLKEDKKWRWCKDVILVIEISTSLDATYVKYLESRLVQIAKDVGKVSLKQNNPKPSKLSSTMSEIVEKDFLEKLFLILDNLDVDIFSDWQKHTSKQKGKISSVDEKLAGSDIPIFKLVSKQRDVFYRASLKYEVEGKKEKFTILKGSYARGEWIGKNDYGSDKKEISELKRKKFLKETPDKRWQFEEDYTFDTISAAAKAIVGRNANGYEEWKVKDGKKNKTFKEWQTEWRAKQLN